MKRAHLLALAVAVALVTGSSKVHAGEYGLHSGLPWFGYGFSGSLYGLGRIPVPPYFALHPPVYYSQPIPRPYGHSPFAWGSSESGLLSSKPKLTINPYHKAKPVVEKEAESSQTARVIVNPHFLAGQQLVSD